MKKFLKTLAVCFMALISCFTFFACNETKNLDTPNNSEQGTTPGGSTTPSGGSNGGQTTTQINEANYTKMKNLANATDPTNGYKVEIINKDAMTSTVDYTDFNFAAMGFTSNEQIDAFKESMEEEMEGDESVQKIVVAYNSTEKTGYTLDYEDEELKSYSVSTADTLYKCDITRNDAGETMTASEDGAESETPVAPTYEYTKYKFNIDNNYFNQYINDFEYECGEMLDGIVQDSLSDLGTKLTENFKMFNVVANPTSTVTCTEADGITTMIVKLEVADIESIDMTSMMGMELKNVTAIVEYEFKFNSTSLLSVEGKISLNGSVSMNLAEMMSEGETPALILTINMNIEMSTKFVLGEYNETDKPEIVDDEFKGTGADDAVEDRKADVYLYIGDYNYKEISRTMNDDFVKADIFKYNEYDETNYAADITNLASLTWYTDKECTVPYTGTKFTSYDMKLYAKLDDITLGEDKAYYVSTSAKSYDADIDYSDYFGRLSIMDKTGTVANYCSYMYVNGEEYTTGQTYTLDTTKINEIIYIYKPSV